MPVLTPTCPDCKGEREIAGIGCGPAGCKAMTLPCRTCGATGRVSPLTLKWIEDGQVLRAARMARDLTLREAAKLLGLPASEYSDAEHGRCDPEPFMVALRTARVR